MLIVRQRLFSSSSKRLPITTLIVTSDRKGLYNGGDCDSAQAYRLELRISDLWS